MIDPEEAPNRDLAPEKLSDAELVGLEVFDVSGEQLGIVANVEQARGGRRIVLDDNEAFPLYATTLQKGGLLVDSAAVQEALEGEPAFDTRSPDDAGDHSTAGLHPFEAHFEKSETQPGLVFSDYEPAYRLGRKYGQAAADQQRSFEDVEEEIREQYEAGDPSQPYHHMREAVRYGYERELDDTV